MAATKPIPVRIQPELMSRIDTVAKQLGTCRSRLIVFCVESFVSAFLQRGKLIMPPNWQEILESMDGRRRRVRYLEKAVGGYQVNEPKPQNPLEHGG